MRTLTPVFFVFLFGQNLHADGVLEINQACALNGGCFSGDSGGFPVTIDGSAGKSYRLTGDLDLSTHPTLPAIAISESFVTLDLNGFQIAGATECVIEPVIGAELICEPGNAGAHGIELSGEVRSVAIKNGTIRKMPDDGIAGSGALLTHVENVAFSENAGWGVILGDRSLIQNSRAERNGAGGFSMQDDSNISHSLVYGNDGVGIEAENRAIVSHCNTEAAFLHRALELGAGSKYKKSTTRGPARCGGGICTELRRYYLTMDPVFGNGPTTACEDGFHFASIFEVVDTANLAYDTVLGLNEDDSGNGPPASQTGWIRTGRNDGAVDNCEGWGSDTTGTGKIARLGSPDQLGASAEGSSPWDIGTQNCNDSEPVWCMEN
jgi:hypothetical protein